MDVFWVSKTPRHTNPFLFCSWMNCLSQASPFCNFRGSADTNRNVLHWLWKFIFEAANLYLAEDGEVMIAIEIVVEISQLINLLTVVRLPWKWVALPGDTVSKGNWLMMIHPWFSDIWIGCTRMRLCLYVYSALKGELFKSVYLAVPNMLDDETGFRIIWGDRGESCASSLQT